LYTFKECDYKTIWFALDIMVKPLDTTSGKNHIRNISPTAAAEQTDEKVKQKKDRIDKALEKEGVPYPGGTAAGEAEGEDYENFSSYDDEDELMMMMFNANNGGAPKNVKP
jgi:hypothetical protein